MRAYFFCNFYLSSIQQGIQSAHCMHEMFTKYRDVNTEPQTSVLYDWANNHKTMIVLNGGDSQSIAELYELLAPLAKEGFFPFAKFSEDERSLNNALTCVGVVLPESIYDHDLKAELQTIQYGVAADVGEIPLSFNGRFKQLISQYHLAK